jgi:hypothetical protein
MTIFFVQHKYVNIILYILELPSSWSTSWIRPSWPQSRVELRLLLLCFMSILFVCLGPPSILLFAPRLKFQAHPSLLAGQLSTDVQVNNTAIPHLTYTYTHIYITFMLLLIFFFTLPPSSWAGWLAQTLPVWHSNDKRKSENKKVKYNRRAKIKTKKMSEESILIHPYSMDFGLMYLDVCVHAPFAQFTNKCTTFYSHHVVYF